MPRIQRNRNADDEATVITYSVLDRDEASIGADFLIDPDRLRDSLPQPYRRIDKIIQELLDDTWLLIDSSERHRLAELSKPRPDKYKCLAFIENMDHINCMCASEDDESSGGELVFVGHRGSVSCVDAAAQSRLDQVDLTASSGSSEAAQRNANVVRISSVRLKQSCHLVVSLSDTGVVFMHLFTGNKFHPVQPLMDAELEPKIAYRKCELSKGCAYMALLADD